MKNTGILTVINKKVIIVCVNKQFFKVQCVEGRENTFYNVFN